MRKHQKNKQPLRQRTIKTARQWVIPGAHNHFHPKLLRPVGLVMMALLLAFIPTFYNLAAAGRMQVLGYAANITVGDLYTLGNDERAKAGLAPLALNNTLSQAAYNKAQDMFANNYWAHDSPSGLTPWSFITGAGYSYSTAGENLAKNFTSSAGVMYGWMNSPTHRANVLGSQYQDIGYAVMNGVLQGEETTLVVAMYASPYVAPTPPPAPAATTQAAPPAASQPSSTQPAAPVQVTAPEQAAPAETKETSAAEKTGADQQKEHADEAAATDTSQAIPGNVEGAMTTFAPLKAYASLNWGQKASFFILSVLLLLFIMKHTAIWRSRRRGLRDIWLRAHPMAQGGVLVVAIIITLLSGTGSIL